MGECSARPLKSAIPNDGAITNNNNLYICLYKGNPGLFNNWIDRGSFLTRSILVRYVFLSNNSKYDTYLLALLLKYFQYILSQASGYWASQVEVGHNSQITPFNILLNSRGNTALEI